MGGKSSKQKKNKKVENGEAEGVAEPPPGADQNEVGAGDATASEKAEGGKTDENHVGEATRDNAADEDTVKAEDGGGGPQAQTETPATESAPVEESAPAQAEEAKPEESAKPVEPEPVKPAEPEPTPTNVEPEPEPVAAPVEESQPPEEPSAPLEDAPAPVEETQPPEEPPAPVEEPPAPVEEPEAPVEEPPAPVEEPPAPVEEPEAPVEELPAPVEEPAAAEPEADSAPLPPPPVVVDAPADADATAAAPSDTPETGAADSSGAGDAVAEPAATSQEHKSGNNVKKTEFKWEEGGENVLVSGSFNDWAEKIVLNKSGEVFSACIELPAGEYLYKYIVDEQWVVNKNQPVKDDDNGQENNVILVA